MPKWFNTAGPCQPDIHYMVPPVQRLPKLKRIIEQRGYFVIHAPRQSGKTTAMLTLAQELTASGTYAAILVSAEVGQPFSQDLGKAERAILDAWRGAAQADLPPELQPPPWPNAEEGRLIGAALQAWAIACPRPLVVFIDEIDALMDATLIAILRQLRDGYPRRPHHFPHALALIGMRDVRDYKAASGGSQRLQTASPFNIKVESLTLPNFTADEIAQLYQQHTDTTGQVFTSGALQATVDLTQGQPWLVNALAKEVVEDILPASMPTLASAEDSANPTLVPSLPTSTTPIEQQHVEQQHIYQAKERLIQRRDTHLDSLAQRLEEPRIRAVLEPLMAGQELNQVPLDDRDYLVDLGLIRRSVDGGLVIANPIYQEVLPRILASG